MNQSIPGKPDDENPGLGLDFQTPKGRLQRIQDRRLAVGLFLSGAVFFLGVYCLFGSLSSSNLPDSKSGQSKLLDLNSASYEELCAIPKIGPLTVKRILRLRKEKGRFESVDDLLAVRGIGKKTIKRLEKYLRVLPVECPKPPK